jgi:hypothetical protein
MEEKGVSKVMLSCHCPLPPRCPSLSEVAASDKGPRELGLRGEGHGLELGTISIGTQSSQHSVEFQLQAPICIWYNVVV